MKRHPRHAPLLAGAAGVAGITMPLEPVNWLSAAEAAAYLKIFRRKDGKPSVGAIRNLVYRKLLQAYKPFGRLLFNRQELDRHVIASKKGNDHGY